MQKVFSRFSVLFLLLFLSTSPTVLAEQHQTPEARVVVCLEREQYVEPSCLPDAECFRPESDDFYPDPERKDHTVIVSGEGFLPGRQTFIVGCVLGSDSRYKCTTGSQQLDEELADLGFATSQDYPEGFVYEFKAKENPITPQTNRIRTVVRSFSNQFASHVFFGIYPFSAGDQVETEGATVKLGTINFQAAAKNCVSIQWDPTGYVFDAQTLEPIPDVEVRVLKDDGTAVEGIGFQDIIKTQQDGSFSFFVDPGKYIIEIDSDEYIFPTELEEVNPDYNNSFKGQDYKCEIPGFSLYTQQAVFDETKGELIRCDVPLKKRLDVGEQRIADPRIYESGIFALGKRYMLKAHIWPLRAYVGVFAADKLITYSRAEDGWWEESIDAEEIPQGSSIRLQVILPEDLQQYLQPEEDDQSLLQKIFKFLKTEVFALSDSVELTPIPRYLEGFVYDKQQNISPGAEVEIVDEATGRILLVVKADENGFIRVLPEYLPIFPYYLRVKNDKETFDLSVDEFINQNITYLQTNELNLLTAEKQKQPIRFSEEEKAAIVAQISTPEKTSLPVREKNIEPRPDLGDEDQVDTDEQQRQRIVYTLIFALFGLSVVGLILLLYFLRLKRQS